MGEIDSSEKFTSADGVTCWSCGGQVTFKAYYTIWECSRCDVTGAKADLHTPPYSGNLWKFTALDAVVTEPYVDHVHQHVPSPA